MGRPTAACSNYDLAYFRTTGIRRQVPHPGFATVQDDIGAECYFERLPNASRNKVSNDPPFAFFVAADRAFSAATR